MGYPHHRPVDKTVSSLGSGRIFPKITSGTTGSLLHFSDVPCSTVPFPGIIGDFYSIGSLKPGTMVMLPFCPAYLLQPSVQLTSCSTLVTILVSFCKVMLIIQY